MIPADERLESANVPVFNGDDGLIHQEELLGFQSLAQVCLEHEAILYTLPHGGIEDDKSSFTSRLGFVHCGVGVAKNAVGIGVANVADNNAHTRCRENFMSAK